MSQKRNRRGKNYWRDCIEEAPPPRPGINARATLETKSRLKPAQIQRIAWSRLQPAFCSLVARALMPGRARGRLPALGPP